MWYILEPKILKVLERFFPECEHEFLEAKAREIYDEYSFSESFEDLWEKDLPPIQDKNKLEKIGKRLKLCAQDLSQVGFHGNASLENVAKLYQREEYQRSAITRQHAAALSRMLRDLAGAIQQAKDDIKEDNQSIFFTDEERTGLVPKRGRKIQVTKEKIALHLARLYLQVKGKKPSITVNPYVENDQHTGIFHDLTEEVFLLLSLEGKTTNAVRKALDIIKTEK